MTRFWLLLLLAPACVLSPNWGDSPTRRDPIDFSGMASRPNAPLRIQAWHHAVGAFEDVATFTGGTTRYASSPEIYGWSRVGVRLADRYWVPASAPFDCRSGGMANIRVLETDGVVPELATFDAAGEACLAEQLADGVHPVTAGNTCKMEDERIVLFSPPQCVPAVTSSDATPAEVTIRLSSATHAYQRKNGQPDLTITGLSRTASLTAAALVRDRDGGVSSVQLAGETRVVCRSTSDGSMLVLPIAVTASSSQPVSSGALVEIGLEASRLVNVPGLVGSTCPAGFAFQRIEATLLATGANASGGVVTSPRLLFTI